MLYMYNVYVFCNFAQFIFITFWVYLLRCYSFIALVEVRWYISWRKFEFLFSPWYIIQSYAVFILLLLLLVLYCSNSYWFCFCFVLLSESGLRRIFTCTYTYLYVSLKTGSWIFSCCCWFHRYDTLASFFHVT